MIPRPVRLNNPGDIERVAGTTWQGEADTQPDPRFICFKDAPFGFRALARTLLTYQNVHGLKTVGQIINRWAPPSENPTKDYAKLVADECRVGVDDEIDVDTVAIMQPMCRAIAREESGLPNPWPDSVIADGLHRAGIADAKPPPLASQSHVVAQAGGVTALGGAGALELVNKALDYGPTIKKSADQLQDYSSVPIVAHVITILLTVGGGLAILGIVLTVLKWRKAA